MKVLSAWLMSFRLKTLPLAISAIILGNALAYWQNTFDLKIFILTAITACLLQILSNLANDYGDGLKGTDKIDRVGPKRGLHNGLITLEQLYTALIINIILCIGFGLLLLIFACQTLEQLIGFIIIGALAILAAITYTIGNKAYGYYGLGDISVLIFFGFVSVLGSYYLQTKTIKIELVIPALGCGLLSTAVLNINNLRDFHSDKLSQKNTLVVLCGIQFAKYYQLILLLFSYLLFTYFSYTHLHSKVSYLYLFTLPLGINQAKFIIQQQDNKALGSLLVPTVKLALLTICLFSLGIILN